MPCDSSLFQAKSASQWIDLLDQGHQICMPTMRLSSRHATFPVISKSIDVISLYGVLFTIRLRISENCSRLLSGSKSRTADQSFVPWRTFEDNSEAKLTSSLLVSVVKSYGDMLGLMNPNCMVLWHNMCIMLTADLRMFEIGAGCAGAIAGRKALENIATWTQTTAARRAILHAAQTFKLMSNRRASDGDPFHSSHSLFLSALVLSLYVFMVPGQESDRATSSFELLDDVNWIRVGSEGLSQNSSFADDPVTEFIRNGGSISLAGVVHHGGYQSARRILLDFAQLLEDVGRWRVGRYTRVLRIMSDALVDEDITNVMEAMEE